MANSQQKMKLDTVHPALFSTIDSANVHE